MTLLTLTQQLRDQVTATGAIVLNAQILGLESIAKLQSAFQLAADESVTIKNLVVSQIPDVKDGKLVISAGSVDLLKQLHLVPTIVFTVDATDTLQFVIGVELSEGWSFKDSFPTLDIFPFPALTISDPYFAYSSQAVNGYAPWADKPQELIDLQPALNFAGATRIGEEDFALQLVLNESGSSGTGSSPLNISWTATSATTLQLADIANALGFTGADIPTLPQGLGVSLESADLTYDYNAKDLEIEAAGRLTIAGITVPLQAARKDGVWTLLGAADAGQEVDFVNLITSLFQEFGLTLPDHLPEFALKNLQVDYDFDTGELSLGGESSVPSPVQFGNATHEIDSQLDLKISTDASGQRTYAGSLRGTVTFGGAVFQGEFDLGSATVLRGYWDGSAGSLKFDELAAAHGIDHSLEPPGNLPLELTRAAFEYDVPQGRFLLSADSKYGEAFFITSNANSQWDFAFGILIELSDIPGFPSLDVLSVQDTMLVLSTVQDDSFVVPTLPGVQMPGQLAASPPRTFPTIGTTKMHLQPGVSVAAVLPLANGGSSPILKTLYSAVGQSELLIQASVADMSNISFTAYLDGSLTIAGGGSDKLVLADVNVELVETTSGLAIEVSGAVIIPFNHVTLQVRCALAISDASMQALLQLKAEQNGQASALPVTFGLPGAPLDELDIEVGVDFEPPGVDLGVEGKFHLVGEQPDANDFTIVLDLEGEIPNPEYLATHIQSITIAEVITACTGIAVTDAPPVLTVIEASDISMYWAESAGIVLPDGTLSQGGFGFNGLLTVGGFTMHAGLAVGPTTGVSGDAEMSPLNLGGVFSLTGNGVGVTVKQVQAVAGGPWQNLAKPLEPGSTLPTRDYQVIAPGGAMVAFNSKKSPFLDVSAKASLFNFLNEEIEIEIRDDGFSWKQLQSIGSVVSIEFDCAVSAATGFAASAAFDLNIKGDIGPFDVLGFDLGTLHLDISLAAAMAITVNSSGFSLSVSGSFHFEGDELTMPALTITENFKSFEDLPEAILKHIEDKAEEIFSDLFNEANQLLDAGLKEAEAIGSAAEAEAKQIGADAEATAEKVVAGATAAYEAAQQDAAQAAVEATKIECDAVTIATDAAAEVVNIAADAKKVADQLDADAVSVVKAAAGVVDNIGKALTAAVTQLRGDAQAVFDAAQQTAIQIGKDAGVAVAAIEKWGSDTVTAIATEATQIVTQIEQETEEIGEEIEQKLAAAAQWLERQAQSVWHEVSKY
ncbi:MAG: hypothetical protein QOE77_3637 [Blastocatellia bacterium]|jgi:hypothetical protein|nr:hypothetical protein [Blastocatellia bacterium]